MNFLDNRDGYKRLLIVTVCLFILAFGLHVKLDLHGSGFSSQIAPCDVYKLRYEPNSSKTFLPAVVICWVLAAPMFLLLQGQPLVQRVFASLISHDPAQVYQRRFLRPPPIFLS